MNKDEDADYEVAANISAKELVDALKGYAYTYDYAGKTSDNGKVLEELYVTCLLYTSNIAQPVSHTGCDMIIPTCRASKTILGSSFDMART